MKFLFRDHLRTAVHSLRLSRTRSILTALGVAIGIASVTAILALAEGITQSVSDQVDAVGGNVAVVRPDSVMKNDNITLKSLSPQGFSTSTLTLGDVERIRNIDVGLTVAPIMTLSGTLQTNGGNSVSAAVVATTPELAETANLTTEEGQFIDNQTSHQTAVIGQQLAIDLFGKENPVGATFNLRSQKFTVIGILKRQNTPVNYSGIDFDKAAMVHFDAGVKLSGNHVQIQQINILATSSGLLESKLAEVKKTIQKAHNNEQDFTIHVGSEIAEPTNQMLDGLARVMTAIAAISLLVGGIGIMNIMLVSVAERTREIGIRKSVGASNLMILCQFLIESLAMSVMGGVAGIALGGLVSLVVGSFMFFVPVFSWEVIGIAFGLSVAVGVLFGMYPAIRAARKDPIDSLRQYR